MAHETNREDAPAAKRAFGVCGCREDAPCGEHARKDAKASEPATVCIGCGAATYNARPCSKCGSRAGLVAAAQHPHPVLSVLAAAVGAVGIGFYCGGPCHALREVRFADNDIVCDTCGWVIATWDGL